MGQVITRDVQGISNEQSSTHVGDPAYHDHVERITEIPTKDYADEVFPNITDVSAQFDQSLTDGTHPFSGYDASSWILPSRF